MNNKADEIKCPDPTCDHEVCSFIPVDSFDYVYGFRRTTGRLSSS